MNNRFVLYSIGKLLQVLAIVMLIPTGIAVWEIGEISADMIRDPRILGFIIAMAVSLTIGTILILLPKREMEGNAVREGFAIVTFGWIVLALIGCIPLFAFLVLSPETANLPKDFFTLFTDSYFESMSGFTTTGATILSDIEILPKGILFWRSMTHWLGGMGIVTLGLAIFPAVGITAYQMFRGEVPGPSAERIRPRLAQTAKILWGVYALLTLAETLLLWFGNMTFFDALCHAFGTMATGGFSTRNASIAAYNSAYIDWVIIVFMFLAGINFMLHYRIFFHRDFSVLGADREFRFYALIIIGAIVFATVVLQLRGPATPEQVSQSFRNEALTEQQVDEKIRVERDKVGSIGSSIRYTAFQVISLTTTTGYGTADFDVWPTALRFGLVILMFFGGCAGSTGGGIKMIRIMVIIRSAWREVLTMIQPRLIAPVKIAGKALEEKQIANIIGFFSLFILLFAFFSIVMSLIIPDFITAVTSVVATMCNIGPGLSGIGATENYGWIPVTGKWVLVLCMLLGRLEIYTVLIAFSPPAWRK